MFCCTRSQCVTNWLNLETLGFWSMMPKHFPRHCLNYCILMCKDLLNLHEPAEVEKTIGLVRDDPELLEDDGKVTQSQGKGWRFDSRLWSLLSPWLDNLPGGQLPHALWCWHVKLLSQKKTMNEKWINWLKSIFSGKSPIILKESTEYTSSWQRTAGSEYHNM